MTLHWMHLLPVDQYVVRTNSVINEFDRKVITLLYQPLIGAIAHSLFFALVSELERDEYTSMETTHKTLMTMMGIPLDKIFEERKKLEGIGLLNVYKKKQEDTVRYIYELQKPFHPQDFFKDDVLSVYLYNRVGKHRYLQLRERFSLDKINKEEYKETTLSFSDVFTSLHHSEMSAYQGELSASLSLDPNQEMVTNQNNSHYSILEDTFDFSLLTVNLSPILDIKKLLTDNVREMIVRLAFLYRIEPFEMSRIIQDSLQQDDTIDLDLLRDKIKNWYRFIHDSEPPGLGLRTQPEQYRTMTGKRPSNEEEEMIFFYETESPLTLFESRSNGTKVSVTDVKIIETLLLDYKLLPGVANVLIDYVLRIDNKKFTKGYVEKIAGQWARSNVKTVKEAMELAKQEYKSQIKLEQGKVEMAVSKEKQTKFRQNGNRNVRKDKLPKWLTGERNDGKAMEESELEKLKAELELELKQLKNEKSKGSDQWNQ